MGSEENEVQGPGDVPGKVARLAHVSATQRERGCHRLAVTMLERHWVPLLILETTDFSTDPNVICAQRYWRLRLLAEPSTAVAVECAAWLTSHVFAACRQAVAEEWAVEFGQLTSDSVEAAGELADAAARLIAAPDASGEIAYFATLYHAVKLRERLMCVELGQWLERSPLGLACGSRWQQQSLFLALRAFAAYGDKAASRSSAEALRDRAWTAASRGRTATEGCVLCHTLPFHFSSAAEQGAVLSEYASSALDECPQNAMLHKHLAHGQRLLGHVDEALEAVDDALRLLPANGDRLLHNWRQSMLLRERERIMVASTARPTVPPRRSEAQTKPQVGDGDQKPRVGTVVRRMMRRPR